MKKHEHKALGSILLALLFFFLSGCTNSSSYGEPWDYYVHPDFVTAYTEEQHIQRIKERTQTRFSEDLENGVIVNYTVEIVYAFYDNDSEYFLVNLEYAEEVQTFYPTGNLEYQTRYKHFLGYIENDEYYTGLSNYTGDNFDEMFIDGRSAYEVSGYSDMKKYYGSNIFAVKTNEGLLQIFDIGVRSSVEFGSFENQWEQRIIRETEYENLMKNNYKFSSHVY